MVWPPVWRLQRPGQRRFARIVLEGLIAGEARRRVLRSLERLTRRRCAGLLLRIDSPGGTVGDSQEIHQALRRLRQDGCPIVASYGNISASGGVYVGSAADRVVANPGTITGSIGVILRGNNLEELLRRVGVRFETIKSGPYKDILSPDRPLTGEERSLLQDLIDSSYDQFVTAVAEGRGLTRERVRSFADGRVFSGAQALELGLVDLLGDEETARLELARLAGVAPDRCRPRTLAEPRRGLLQRLRQEMTIVFGMAGQPLWLFHP
jgi:protease-4